MMFSYLKILRPSVILLAAFAVFVGSIIVNYYQWSQILLAVLIASLIAGAGNITNDYFDYNVDRINKPKRAIPSGKIKRKTAAIYALLLYMIADILAIVFLNYYMKILAILSTFITFLYAWKLKRTPFGHFIDSWLTSSTFLFGALFANINATIVILFSTAYLSNLGREITKGIEDMEGDKKVGAKTFAVVTGKIFSAWVAIFFIVFAVLISFVPYIYGLLNIKYLVLVVFSDITFVISCFILLINPAKSQKIMKIAMFIAIIAFLAGTY